jgi:hypothetical protein
MQRTIQWLLIIGALIVWGLTDFVSTLATCQHEQQEKAQQSPEQSCGFADSLTAAAIKDTAELIETRHAFVTATATIVVAFFTFTLWRATNRLWDAGERQLRYLSETAERQLRAYVFVVQIKVTDPDSQHPQAEVVIRNTGQTPAHDTIVSSAANVYNFPPPTTVFDPTPVGPASSRFVFGPDGLGHKHIPLKTLLNEVVMRGMRDGQCILYVWGEVLYKDVFGKSQYTKFRFMIGGESAWPETNLMVVCPEGNEAT